MGLGIGDGVRLGRSRKGPCAYRGTGACNMSVLLNSVAIGEWESISSSTSKAMPYACGLTVKKNAAICSGDASDGGGICDVGGHGHGTSGSYIWSSGMGAPSLLDRLYICSAPHHIESGSDPANKCGRGGTNAFPFATKMPLKNIVRLYARDQTRASIGASPFGCRHPQLSQKCVRGV